MQRKAWKMKRLFLFLWYVIGAIVLAPGLVYFLVSYKIGILKDENQN